MTDRNAMLQGLSSPVVGQGIISGKAALDFVTICERKRNASDPRTSLTCYPGGGDDINHDAMPGDTSFGQKDVRNAEIMDGEPNELGTVSVAGLNWGGYCSQRDMEDDHYWEGIVTTESRLTNPLDSSTGDPDHGYGTARTGTLSVINNGLKTIYAGNKVAWQFPAAPFHPKGDVYDFNGGSTTNMLARYGVPTTQFRPEYVPFDHTDFSVQFAAAFAAISSPKVQGGVSDIGFVASLPNINGYKDSKPWSGIQDEANALKYGAWGFGLTLIETLLRRGFLQVVQPTLDAALAQTEAGESYEPVDAMTSRAAHEAAADLSRGIGLWNTSEDGQKIVLEGIADILLKNISPEDARRELAVKRFEDGSNKEYFTVAVSEPRNHYEQYARLRVHGADLFFCGVTGAWYSKTSKIVGTSLNSAAPADTLHVNFGHFCSV